MDARAYWLRVIVVERGLNLGDATRTERTAAADEQQGVGGVIAPHSEHDRASGPGSIEWAP